MTSVRIIGLVVASVLAITACNRGDEAASGGAATTGTAPVTTIAATPVVEETTTVPAPSTTEESAPSGDGGVTSTATDAEPGPAMPEYEVVHRLIEDGRETLVILVEPGSHTSVQLENLVYDIVETHSPSAAIVVDDRAAADLALLEERTGAEQDTLDSHTFLRIENGVEVTFLGPYADFPGLTVGS